MEKSRNIIWDKVCLCFIWSAGYYTTFMHCLGYFAGSVECLNDKQCSNDKRSSNNKRSWNDKRTTLENLKTVYFSTFK